MMPATRARTRAATKVEKESQVPKRRRISAPAPRTSRRRNHEDVAAEDSDSSIDLPVKRTRTTRKGREYQSANSAISSSKNQTTMHEQSPLEAGIVGRETQIAQVRGFLRSRLDEAQGGSLYVCGSTGTGKTACVRYVLESELGRKSSATGSRIHVGKLNGNTLEKPALIYGALLRALGVECPLSTPPEAARADLEDLFRPKTAKRGNLYVIMLDEIDQLVTQQKPQTARQEVLYQIFRWANLPRSRLILIGIANAVNLHDRFLPELLREGYSSEMLVFPSYTKDELRDILSSHTERLAKETSVGNARFEAIAIELCARKVAAKSGDLRKALDICKRALLDAAVAKKSRSPAQGSDQKKEGDDIVLVSAPMILKTMKTAFESSHVKTIREMPLQVQYALCAIIRQQRATQRDGKRKMLVADVFKEYVSMAREWGLPSQPFSDFRDTLLSRLLEDGLVALAGIKKDVRERSLRVDVLEDDVVHALSENIATQPLISGKSRRHNGGINLYTAS